MKSPYHVRWDISFLERSDLWFGNSKSYSSFLWYKTKKQAIHKMRAIGGNFMVTKWFYKKGIRYARVYEFYTGIPLTGYGIIKL